MFILHSSLEDKQLYFWIAVHIKKKEKKKRNRAYSVLWSWLCISTNTQRSMGRVVVDSRKQSAMIGLAVDAKLANQRPGDLACDLTQPTRVHVAHRLLAFGRLRSCMWQA